MFDSHAFFKQRFAAHLKETSRYLRYMFNGHIAIALLFFISAMAFYYQQWLAQLQPGFPTAFVIGIIFGFVVSYSPVSTLLKEPDLVFLIVAEHQMGAYFRNAIIYSFVIQLYLVLLAVAALGPLYFATYADRSGKVYLLTFVVVLVFKLWNLITNWWMQRIRDASMRYTDQIVRFLLNSAVFYFLIKGDLLLAGIITLLFMVVFFYVLSLSRKQPGIVWEMLVEKDRNRMQAFYRIANMFTDVPHIKNKVKKRQWLVSIVSKVPFENKFTFDYLYRISFVRSGDYFGMYVRLIVIGGLVIYYVPNMWMKIIFGILFLYMSSFQMMTLYQHHRTIMWLDIYPVDLATRQEALMKWLMQLMIIQTILFALVFLVTKLYMAFVIMLACGMLFNYLFIYGYVKSKLSNFRSA